MASPRSRKPQAAAVEAPVAQTQAVTVPAVTLESVTEATKAGGFEYTTPEFHTPLIASGDVEINPEMTNEHGMIATRATAKHLTEVEIQGTKPMTAPETLAPVAAAVKPKFVIETGIAIPERKRVSTGLRAGRAPVYPFDDLEIGASFFVPNVGEKSAAKAMASTVAGANARYQEEIEGQTRVNRKGKTVTATKQLRKFQIFDTERTDPATGEVQKGARVFRVSLD